MMLVFVLALMEKKKRSSNRSVNICKNDRLTTGAESIRPQVQNLTADKCNHRYLPPFQDKVIESLLTSASQTWKSLFVVIEHKIYRKYYHLLGLYPKF